MKTKIVNNIEVWTKVLNIPIAFHAKMKMIAEAQGFGGNLTAWIVFLIKNAITEFNEKNKIL